MEATLFRVSLLLLGIIMLFVSIIISVRRRTRKRDMIKRGYLEKIRTRDVISFESFARTYFPSQNPQVVCTILGCIKAAVQVPTDRLHPDDDISDDLALGAWDGLEPYHVIADIEDHLGNTIKLKDDDKVQTLGQFVELCCRNPETPSQGIQ